MRSATTVAVLIPLMAALVSASCGRERDPSSAATGRPAAEDGPEGSPGETPPPAPAARATVGRATGSVSGRVVYRGPLPEKTTMYVHEAMKDMEAHTIIVDRATRGLKNAVVWVEGVRPRTRGSALPPAVMDQRDWTFLPHVLAVRAGQTVRFLNSDVANHNVHSWTPGQEFNLGSPSGTGVTHRFRRPTGTEPVRIHCDIHTWMLAWIYVFPHDAFAVTDSQGRFRMEGVPAGTWRLRAHHADGGLETEVDVEVGAQTAAEVLMEVRGTGDGPEPEE